MLETLLKIHEDSESLDFKEVWKEGVFVFDSNVLLDLYRLPEPASNDLINVLNNGEFNKKVWIGFQVILEFLNNRHEAISDQKNKFNTVRSLIDEAITQYDEVFENLSKGLSKLRLKQRHSLIDPDKFVTQDNIDKGRSFLEEFIEELSVLENKQSDVNDEDKIKDIVLGIFEGKVGDGFSKKELEEIYKVGEKRYENSVPPGYKDKAKQGSYKVKDREFIRKYGDLILWKEILRKASSENIPHIILVTGDVKEDWWLEKRGKKLGPRKELLNEIYSEAPNLKTFYLYDTSSFLKYAKSELRLAISDSSINQAKDLIERVRRNRFVHEEGYIFIPDFIKKTASQINGFKIGIGRSVYNLPPVRIKESSFYSALMEIFHNAIEHGIQSYVGVQAKRRADVFLLRFKNKILPNPSGDEGNDVSSDSASRGLGLKGVMDWMSKDKIDIRIVETQKSFVVEMYIPISLFYFEGGDETA